MERGRSLCICKDNECGDGGKSNNCDSVLCDFLLFLLPIPSIFITLHYIVQHRCQLCSQLKTTSPFCSLFFPSLSNLSCLSSLSSSFHIIFHSLFFLSTSPLFSSSSIIYFWWCVLICSVLSSGSSVYFIPPFFSTLCFFVHLSLSLSLMAERMTYERQSTSLFFFFHFSDRQPLIHVPIILSAWGPLGQAQKTQAVKHLFLLSLQSSSLLSLLRLVLLSSPLICLSFCRSSTVGLAPSGFLSPTTSQSHSSLTLLISFFLSVCFSFLCMAFVSHLVSALCAASPLRCISLCALITHHL